MSDLAQQWQSWAKAGTALGSDDRAYAEWCAEGDWLLDQSGHGQCSGWTFGHSTGVMLCGCGEDPVSTSLLVGAGLS